MRVSAPRPRHTSHGDEKSTDTAKETSGEKTDETTPKEQQEETTGEEQASRFVIFEYFQRTAKEICFFFFFSAVANRAAGQMVGGTFVPVSFPFSVPSTTRSFF